MRERPEPAPCSRSSHPWRWWPLKARTSKRFDYNWSYILVPPDIFHHAHASDAPQILVLSTLVERGQCQWRTTSIIPIFIRFVLQEKRIVQYETFYEGKKCTSMVPLVSAGIMQDIFYIFNLSLSLILLCNVPFQLIIDLILSVSLSLVHSSSRFPLGKCM